MFYPITSSTLLRPNLAANFLLHLVIVPASIGLSISAFKNTTHPSDEWISKFDKEVKT